VVDTYNLIIHHFSLPAKKVHTGIGRILAHSYPSDGMLSTTLNNTPLVDWTNYTEIFQVRTNQD